MKAGEQDWWGTYAHESAGEEAAVEEAAVEEAAEAARGKYLAKILAKTRDFFKEFLFKWVRKSNIWDFVQMSQEIKYFDLNL